MLPHATTALAIVAMLLVAIAALFAMVSAARRVEESTPVPEVLPRFSHTEGHAVRTMGTSKVRSLYDHESLLVTWVRADGVIDRQAGGHLRRLPLPAEGWQGARLASDSPVAQILPRVLQGARIPYTLERTDAEGKHREYVGVAEPWYDFGGDIQGGLYVALDVTDAK